MAGRASIAGHPIHPMLTVFPVALWTSSLICDLVYKSGAQALWHDMAFYTMAGGVIGALLAAIPGAIDLFSLSSRRVRRIGLSHMAINLTLVVLFLVNLWWRTRAPADASGPVWLSAASVALLGVSGWLGGEMVYVRGAGVDVASRIPPERAPTLERRRLHAVATGYRGPERRKRA